MERNLRSQHHVTDMVFTLGLFCVFTASMFLLVMIGIQVYRATVSHMQDTYSTRTVISYVAEKVRQHDVTGGVELTTVEDRTALRLLDELGGQVYETYIYSDGDYLCELTVRAGTEADLSMGERILEVQGFSISDAGGGFFELSADDSGGGTVHFLLHPRSAAAQ